MPGGQLIMLPFFDLAVHRWDLSKGTGQVTTMDSRLAEVCFKIIEPLADGMRNGIFGSAVTVSIIANTQDKLLGITGRDQ